MWCKSNSGLEGECDGFSLIDVCVCVQCQSKQPAVTLVPAAVGLDWRLSVSRKPWFITSRQAHGDRARWQGWRWGVCRQTRAGKGNQNWKSEGKQHRRKGNVEWILSAQSRKELFKNQSFTTDQPRRTTSASVCDQLPVSLMNGTRMQSSLCFWEGSASKITWL